MDETVEMNFRAKTAESGSCRLREQTASIIRRKACLRFGISEIPCRRDLVFHENYSIARSLVAGLYSISLGVQYR